MVHTDTLLASTRRGEELRYLTEHFHDLQGLYFAWFWAGLLCFLSSSTQLSRGHILIVALSIIALFLPVGVPCIHAWYKRYGMVQIAAPNSINQGRLVFWTPTLLHGGALLAFSGPGLGFGLSLLELVFSVAWTHTRAL